MTELRTDDHDLTQVVGRTGRRLRRNALLTGAALVALTAIGWLLAAVVIDLVLPLPVWGRVTMWVGFWLIASVALGCALVWPMMRRPTREQIALSIEAAIGGMHNRLLTLIDLQQNGNKADAENTLDRKGGGGFVGRLVDQTRQGLVGYRVEQVADPKPMRRSMAGLGGTLLIALLLSLFLWDRVPTALARITMPMANIPPATYLHVQPPGDLQVLHGEPLTITGDVTRGAADRAMLHYQSADGQWVRYPMARDEAGDFTFTLSAVTADAAYFIRAGRTWTPTHQVQVVPRPVVQHVRTTIHLPDYMKLPEPIAVEVQDHALRAPKGSTIAVAAEVSGEATTGELVFLKAERIVETREREERSVWFDDELPGDAEPVGRWRWSTAQAYSGVRSHTFGWDGEPYGFRTRLNPLRVPVGGAFVVHVYLDPQEPPTALAVTLHSDEHAATLRWGEKAEGAGNESSMIHVGDLPQAGAWAQLEVSAGELPEAMRMGGTRLTGITFEADGGGAYFDRPGSLIRRTEEQERTTYHEVAVEPLERDEEAGLWRGRFELAEDRHYTVRLLNTLEQANAPVRPTHAMATDDAEPGVVVDRPGRDVRLAEPQPLPVTVRAIDDWGLRSIGVQYGPAADELGPVQTLEAFEDVERSRSLTHLIEAARLSYGQTLHYRFVATDRKGQVGHSGTYRIMLRRDDPLTEEDDVAEEPTVLDDLLEGLAELVRSPLDLAEALAELAEALPEDVAERLPETDGAQLLHPDGTPMSDEEVRELFAELHAELDEEQREQLQEFDAMLKDRQEKMREMAEQLRQAAEQAEQSPLSLSGESEAMEMAADELEQLAEQARKQTASDGDEAALEQLAKSDAAESDAQQQRLEQLHKDLKQLEEARETAADDPQTAEAQTEATQARMQAQQTRRALSMLDNAMTQVQREIDALRSEQAELNARTAAADDDAELDELAEQQAELDERIAEKLNETQRVAGRPTEDPEEPDDPEPDEEPAPGTATNPDIDPDDREPDPTARRDELDEHQQQTSEQLDAERAAAEDVQQRSQAADGELTSLTTQLDMAQRQLNDARAEAAQADGEASEASEAAADRQQQAAQQLDSATQEIDALVTSPDVQDLVAMAQRAQGGETQQQSDAPAAAAQQGAAAQAGLLSEEEINLMLMEQAIGPPEERGDSYRLPPRARQSLLQGMRQQAPEGYQSLIDAYYRELSRGDE